MLPGGSAGGVPPAGSNDIVQQIKEFYGGRRQVTVEEPKGLIPTKAALFGLDIRFREVDRRVAEEKAKR